jgi:hypothetical protein
MNVPPCCFSDFNGPQIPHREAPARPRLLQPSAEAATVSPSLLGSYGEGVAIGALGRVAKMRSALLFLFYFALLPDLHFLLRGPLSFRHFFGHVILMVRGFALSGARNEQSKRKPGVTRCKNDPPR